MQTVETSIQSRSTDPRARDHRIGTEELEILPSFEDVEFWSEGASNVRTILVVDDQAPLLDLMRRILEKRGYRVLTARDGTTAVAMVLGGAPVDLAFVDVVMPGLDGPGVVMHLRREARADLRIVMLTGRRGERDMRRSYDAGVDYYVTKPFHPDTVANLADLLLAPEDFASEVAL
jgi:CheY-like chemotaxis protein